MLAATTRPWYLPTWVSGESPVTSPIAHTRVGADDQLHAVTAQDLAERGAERRPSTCPPSTSTASPPRRRTAWPSRRRPARRRGSAAGGHGLHCPRLAVGPDAVEVAKPRHRRDECVRAAGHEDVLGRVAHAVDLDDTGVGEPAAATQQRDARRGEEALLRGV